MIQNLLLDHQEHPYEIVINILMSLHNFYNFYIDNRVLSITLMQLVDNTQFWNVNCLFLSSALCAPASFPAAVTVMVLLQLCRHSFVRRDWISECGFKFDLTTNFIISTCIIVQFNTILCPELEWLISCVVKQIYDILILYSLSIYNMFYK